MQWQFFLKTFMILFYFMIAAQGAFYLTGMYRIMGAMPAEDFVALRKLAHPVLEPRLKALYYTSLICMAAVLVFPGHSVYSAAYAAILTAAICLVIDVVLIVKWSQPLNRSIEHAEPGISAREFQLRWLRQIYIRGWISVAGFFSLLLGAVLSYFRA